MSDVVDRITEVLVSSPSDFRTVLSLCDELDAKPSEVREALAQLESEGIVRRPVVLDSRYDDWYRLVNRGLTRQEKRARWWALITFRRMRDDF